ncbi:hypothetical protein SPHINGO8BC_120014 [Sphingobacterium multivorum]|uniref:Uncharacterized protein n=1 Tax=Sphingobacterium multivorum TaxID=28454 RepID=A0A653YW94_SPHMU|nr:hypothetical protein SPHINGO8BC_120014 [Sphingobacterium multivorum]
MKNTTAIQYISVQKVANIISTEMVTKRTFLTKNKEQLKTNYIKKGDIDRCPLF